MESTRFAPTNKENFAELIGLVFERALAVPHEIKEVFPKGCAGGTVAAILDTARSANTTNDVSYTSWLLYRWCEGRLTLTDMKASGSTLASYADHVADLPIEARNVFGMHNLDEMKSVLSLSGEAGMTRTIRSYFYPAIAAE